MSDPDNDVGSTDEQASTAGATDRWLTDPVLDADLPGGVGATLGDLVGEKSVATLEEWTVEIRRLTDGEAIEVDDLCHAGTETPHWGEMDGERYYFLCFYDAVLLSALADRPVDILTESPEGVVIQAHATGTSDLTVTPAEAVVSFGVERGIEPPSEGDPSPESLYAAVCPYVKAFPDRGAYEAWAGTVPAATVAMSLSGATEVAAALVA